MDKINAQATVESLALARARLGPVSFTLSRIVSTGFPALDQMIPGGGWPRGSVIELVCDGPEAESMALGVLMPALVSISLEEKERWIACIAPPRFPDSRFLAEQGLNLSRLLLVDAHPTLTPAEFVETSLSAKTCSILMTWVDTVEAKQLVRLQTAARKTDTIVFLLRPAAALSAYSTAALRLAVAVRQGRLQVRVLHFRDHLNSLLLLGADQRIPQTALYDKPANLQQRRTRLRAVAPATPTLNSIDEAKQA